MKNEMKIDEVLKNNLIADVENIVSTKLRPQTKAALKRCFEITIGHHYASQHKEQPEIEVFRWLLGYTDFRGREEGEGAYWWRKELRERLKCININIKQK